MGLQDAPFMNAVPAHQILKSRSRPSSGRSLSSSSKDFHASAGIEDDVRSLTLKGNFLNGNNNISERSYRDSDEDDEVEEGEERTTRNDGDEDAVDNEQDLVSNGHNTTIKTENDGVRQ
jgi:hypothetical protein